MKFELNTVYTVPGTADPVEAYEDNCIENVDFYRSLHDKLGYDVDIVRNGMEGDKFVREAVVHPRPEAVPLAVKAFLGAEGLDYRETLTYDPKTHRGTIENKPLGSALRGKVSAKAGFSLRSAAPFAPRKVAYESSYEINANMWRIGGQVEKTMASEVKAKVPAIESFGQEWLDKNVVDATLVSERRAA